MRTANGSLAHRSDTRQPIHSRQGRSAALAGAALVLLLCARRARPAPLPLPPEMQERVNRAIDRGVAFLKATEGRHGTWAAAGAPHPVGYAALPGLTLLECGVPPTDPAVRRAADVVRRSAGQLNSTYDIALAILFLDRLGDPKDRCVIERLATRLIVSQAPTGGWGYRCMTVGKAKQQEILVLLRKLSQSPAGLPLVAAAPGARPPDLGPGVARRQDGPLMGGLTGAPANDPLHGGVTSSLDSPSSGGSQLDAPLSAGAPPETAPPEQKEHRQQPQPLFPSSRWARCIKSDVPSPDEAPELRTVSRGEHKVGAGPVVIPPSLQGLTVFRALDWLGLFDVPGRNLQPLLATTDNSNTQFAMLALWAAGRHGVPVRRTLHRVALRYETSQNANGSWGYLYRRGGAAESAPMTCVGLLGLAVGHGLDRVRGGQGGALRARVRGGFLALSRHVGAPAGRTWNLPMPNLYFLWSVERVAVLYDLQTIAGKDWYRWAAEMLLANQQPAGAWTNGGYPGATPVLDTCLALLILKRANLAKDLAGKLPFDPVALNDFLTRKTETGNRPKEEKKAESEKAPPAPAPPPEAPAKPELAESIARSSGPATRPRDDSNAGLEREEGTTRHWPFVVFSLGALLLLGALIFLVMHLLSEKGEGEEEDEQPATGEPARQPTKRKARPASKLRTSEAG